jgi:surface polysaccharide O-acyltransferase-like enzyme
VLESIPELFSISLIDGKQLLLLKVMQKGLGWTGYYYLGSYLKARIFSNRQKKIIYALGMLSVVASYFIFKWYSYEQGRAVNDFYDNISITVLFESIALFELAKNCKMNFPERIEKWIALISKYTFGVYLVHMLILYAIDRNVSVIKEMPVILCLPITVILVFIISLLISYILNHVPVLHKYIV